MKNVKQKGKNSIKKSILIILPVFLFLLIGTQEVAAFFQDTTQEQQISFNTYKGEVLDADSKKPLVFASIAIEGSNISTITNTEGEFSLKVTKSMKGGNVEISFLGYKTKTLSFAELAKKKNTILMNVSVTELAGVDLSVPSDALKLVEETLAKKGDNYFSDPTLMTGFYRETIKKRRQNVSLSEAVVNIYKTPYTSNKKDAVELYKARKSTDYSKLDTIALKLQGGPFNALFVDIMKYPEYIFTEESLNEYTFSFNRSTRVDGKLLYIIDFKQKENIFESLYKGKLYIDAENKILTRAIYSLNIIDKEETSKMFVRKKPKNASVWPTEVAYRVDYREKNGRWYYGYSNALLEFKIDWDKKLFNSVYSMSSEMAITDWEKNLTNALPKSKERMKSSIILNDEAIGFTDPDFWGEYNIIEPEKSIESAIKKIKRQLKKNKKSGNSKP